MVSLRLSEARFLRELPLTSFRIRTVLHKPGFVAVSKIRGFGAPIRGMADTAAGLVQETMLRYSSKSSDKTAKGVSIMWFRNDLRVLDNEALMRAWHSCEAVVPVYCLDPRHFAKTYYFGFPKTGGRNSRCFLSSFPFRPFLLEFRAQFLLESLADLKKNLRSRGLDLLVRQGKPEEILPALAELFRAHTVYAQEETCSEELQVDKAVRKALGPKIKLELVWGFTMYHLNDLPFSYSRLPDVYTQFRKAVESSSQVRACLRLPLYLGPLPKSWKDKLDDHHIPSLAELGITGRMQSTLGVMYFRGGESEALSRLHDYFWEKDMIRIYKETRNGMLGADYSTKFSPWLALGCLSPRLIYEEVKRYEQQRFANSSTYWVLFELIWRDYFRFLSLKYGNAIFHLEGPRRVTGIVWSQDKELFEAWRTGRTGYPLIDANMRELEATGYMSNRGRQIVCSFLVRDMGIDWRMGAEWFESCLIDHDPCSNYGNWTYGAGVGNDPREDRYFSIPKQAQNYDPEGEYVAHWIPELARFPKDGRHFPKTGYIKPVVPLRYQTSQRTSRVRERQTQGLKL